MIAKPEPAGEPHGAWVSKSGALAGITKKPLTDANASFLYLNFKNTAKNTDSFILWRKYIELFQDI